MSNTTLIPLRQPDTIDDLLTAVLRDGARRLLVQAIEAEAEAFLAERLSENARRMISDTRWPD